MSQILFQDKNFLQLDAVNILISLVASTPTLTYPKINSKLNFGEQDAHVIHLCTVLHLVQVWNIKYISSQKQNSKEVYMFLDI